MVAAFASTVDNTGQYWGTKKVVFGTYTASGGSTGGAIVTGLRQVDALFLQPTSSAVIATQDVIDSSQSFPLAGSSVTIITVANSTGLWWALGSE